MGFEQRGLRDARPIESKRFRPDCSRSAVHRPMPMQIVWKEWYGETDDRTNGSAVVNLGNNGNTTSCVFQRKPI
eukprot:scaffold310_cov335-Pavlova_lutheri.AAC.54